MPKTLITGCAGFIGFHLALRLLEGGDEIVGLDNLNDYYDVGLKQARLARLEQRPGFRFVKLDLASRPGTERLFKEEAFQIVAHLAAQAGVRYSIENPHAYVDANLVGFANVLEGCRRSGVRHLAVASSSSVYGGNTKMPFSVTDPVDHPVSLYAATKRANELMAHSCAHLYGLPCTGLRFFTVYGPWGRPDMAMFIFTRAILNGEPIELYNHGKMRRDFTYIDDAVEAVVRLLRKPPGQDARIDSQSPDRSRSAPFRIHNVGNNNPVELAYLIQMLERKLAKKAHVKLLPIQPGDVPETCADVETLVEETGYKPRTPIEEGVERFVAWYRYYCRT